MMLRFTLLLAALFFSAIRLDAYMTQSVYPNDVVHTIYIPADDPDYTGYRAFLYRDGVQIATMSGDQGEQDDWRTFFTIHDTGAGKAVRTYRLKIESRSLRSDPIGDWGDYEEEVDTVDTASLYATVTKDLTVTGEWKITRLTLSAASNPNLTISNASLRLDRDAFANNKGINYEDGYSGTVTIDNATFHNLAVQPLYNADTADTSCSIQVTNTTFSRDDDYMTGFNGCIETFSNNRGTTYLISNRLSAFKNNEMQVKGSSTFYSFTDYSYVDFSGNYLEAGSQVRLTHVLGGGNNVWITDNTIDGTFTAQRAEDANDTTGKLIIRKTSAALIEIDGFSEFNLSEITMTGTVDIENSAKGSISASTITCANALRPPISLIGNDDVVLSGNTYHCSESVFGLGITDSTNITVKNETFRTLYGIGINNASKLTVSDNLFHCDAALFGYALDIRGLDQSTITRNTSQKECNVGFSFAEGDTLGFTNNVVTDNTFRAEDNYLSGCVDGNTFANNAFLSTNSDIGIVMPAADTGLQCDGKAVTNTWAYPVKQGPNIIGGSKIGGNYWHQHAPYCNDADNDGFCDDPVTLSLGGQVQYHDPLPLAYHVLSAAAGESNPVSGIWSPASKLMKVMHLKISNNALAGEEAEVKKLTFAYKGEGSVTDIQSANLYYDASCQYSTGTPSGTVGASNGAFTFSVSDKIPAEADTCYILEYQIKETAAAAATACSLERAEYCPCAVYGATIDGTGIEATLAGEDEGVHGNVEGNVNAGWPSLDHISDDAARRLVDKSERLASPLQVKLSDIKDACHTQWDAVFSISKTPDGTAGQYLEADGVRGNSVTAHFNSDGIAEADFASGDKSGSYEISVAPKPAAGNSYHCPQATVASLLFEVYTGGITMTGSLDGSDGGGEDTTLSTFIGTIEAKNKLTAEALLPKWAGDPVKVTFAPSWTTAQSDTTAPFEAEFDMQSVPEYATMTVTAETKDGQSFSEIYTFSAIALPEWVNTFNGFPYNGISWKFEDAKKRYALSFGFPDDFAWSNPIPEDIALIGGEEDEAGLSVNASAFYGITRHTAFTGAGKFNGKLFGKEINVEGSMSASFDEQFAVKAAPPPLATFSADITFDLGSKTLASKTLIVYGVPITVQVDVGGSVKVFAEGRLVLSQKLKIDRATFVPGSTITITIDASASVAFGLAKVGAKAEPTGTVKIRLLYTTASAKVTQDQFGGEFSVPVTIYGSLFWGAVSGDLATKEFGPWQFGDDVKASAQFFHPGAATPRADGKHFYATSDAAASGNTTLRVFTADTATGSLSIDPEIGFRLGGFSSGYITNNDLWEIDPAVTFTGETTALAVWTSNDGDKSLSLLNEIMNHQDIAYSYYDGASWSTEALIIDDDNADGMADVASPPNSSDALAVWVHNANTGETDVQNKRGYSIYAAHFDSGQWDTPAALPGTDGGSGDFMPAVTGLADGRYLALWVHDADGVLYDKLPQMVGGTDVNKSNDDCDIFFAFYDPLGGWSAPAALTVADDQTELMPAVASEGSNIAAVWVQKGTDNLQRLYFARLGTTAWEGYEVLDSAGYVMEDPTITVKDGVATITYRRMEGGEQGIYKIEKTLTATAAAARAGTAPVKITDGTQLWHRAALEADGDLQLDWTDPNAQETLKSATLDKTPAAQLRGTYALSMGSGGLSADFTAALTVTTAGTFGLSAQLYDPDGNLLQALASAPVALTAGEANLTLAFDGRRINAAGLDGSYRVGSVELHRYNPDATVIGTVEDAVSAYFAAAVFAEAKLACDAENYYEGKPMLLTVTDPGATAAAVLIESSDGGSATLALSGPDANGTFSKSVVLESTALTLNEGSVITLYYTDGNGTIWHTAAVWSLPPQKELYFDAGWQLISLPLEQSAAVDSLFGGAAVVWGYENGSWSGWSPDTTVNAQISQEGFASLALIEPGKGYYVRSATALTVTLPQTERAEVPAPSLSPGWNLVAVPSDYDTPQKLYDALGTVGRIWQLNDGNWKGWSPDETVRTQMQQQGYGVINALHTDEALWVYVK